MKKLLIVSLLVVVLFLVACARVEEKESVAVSSQEKLEGDLTPAEIAQLPADSKPQKTALSGQATKWENCVDADNTASKWNDKTQLLTKFKTSYTGGVTEDKCYTWYKGTAKEKTRLIEGVCKTDGVSSRFNYWYADCDVSFGKGAKCVDGACVKAGNVNLVLSNVKFESVLSEYSLQYKGADNQNKVSPKIRFKNLDNAETLEYNVNPIGTYETGIVATIKLGVFYFIVKNATSTLVDDFKISVDLDGNGVIENKELSGIGKDENIVLMSNTDVDLPTEALEFSSPVAVSFDVTNEGDAAVNTGYLNQVGVCSPSKDSCHLPDLSGYEAAKFLNPKEVQHYKVSFNFVEDDVKSFFEDNKVKIRILVDGDSNIKETNENDNMFEMVLNVNMPTSSSGGGSGGGSGFGGAAKTDVWKIGTSSNKLEMANSNATSASWIIGESIGSVNSFIGSEELNVLSDGNLVTKSQSFPYKQVLFLPGGYYGGDSRSSIVKYDRNHDNKDADYFFVRNNGNIGFYYLEFTSTAQSKITDSDGNPTKDGTFLHDFEDTKLNIFGKEYTIVRAIRPDTASPDLSIKLVLMESPIYDKILEGETKTYTIGNKIYKITLSSLDSNQAQFIVNDETTGFLNVGDNYILKDLKTELGVAHILYQSYAGGVHSATFFLGTGEMELRDDQITDSIGKYNIKQEFNNIDGTDVRIMGTDDNVTFTISKIEVNMTAQDDYFVGAGQKLSDDIAAQGDMKQILFTGNWDILYGGLSTEASHLLGLFSINNKKEYVLQLYDKNDKPFNTSIALLQDNGVIDVKTGTYVDAYGSTWNVEKDGLNVKIFQTVPNVDNYDNLKPSTLEFSIGKMNTNQLFITNFKVDGILNPSLTPEGTNYISYGYTSMGAKWIYYTYPNQPTIFTLDYPAKQRLPQVYIVGGNSNLPGFQGSTCTTMIDCVNGLICCGKNINIKNYCSTYDLCK